jgi:hypothetical protein
VLQQAVSTPATPTTCPLLALYAQHLREQLVAAINHPQHHDAPLTGLKIAVDAGNGSGGFFATQVGVLVVRACVLAARWHHRGCVCGAGCGQQQGVWPLAHTTTMLTAASPRHTRSWRRWALMSAAASSCSLTERSQTTYQTLRTRRRWKLRWTL